jgi:hypothetical protein
MCQCKNAENKEVTGEKEIDVLLGEELEEDVEAKKGATCDDLEDFKRSKY